MKILSVLGSPRKNRNTAALLNEYLRGALKNQEVSNETVVLQSEKIAPCNGCNSCKNGLDTCIIEDDMQGMYSLIKECDVLVFATPIYWWHMTAQLKAFLDRMYALDFETGFPDKKFVLLMTYDGADPNSGAQLLQETMEEIMDYLKIEIVCTYGVCTGKTQVRDNPEALSKAYEYGSRLTQ
jgi:multimeric flavodoxin WrbA